MQEADVNFAFYYFVDEYYRQTKKVKHKHKKKKHKHEKKKDKSPSDDEMPGSSKLVPFQFKLTPFNCKEGWEYLTPSPTWIGHQYFVGQFPSSGNTLF